MPLSPAQATFLREFRLFCKEQNVPVDDYMHREVVIRFAEWLHKKRTTAQAIENRTQLRGYRAGSSEPSDITCCMCSTPILEGTVAVWLWNWNAIPDNPTCSLKCAQELEAQRTAPS